MAIFDTHGDMCHRPGLEAAFEFAKYWKPEIRIAGGDHFDLRPMRCGADERQERMNDDIEAGIEFLGTYSPTVLLLGNHEDRLRQWVDRGGVYADLSSSITKKIRLVLSDDCEQLEYCKAKGVWRLGHFNVVHGFGRGGITSLKKHTETYGNVLMGHCHRNGFTRVGRHDAAIGFSSGCLCKLNMDYNRTQLDTLAQSHGFMYGLLMPSGHVHVHQAYPVGDTWYLPTEMREYTNSPCDCSGMDGGDSPSCGGAGEGES